jgi:hypothetical protein
MGFFNPSTVEVADSHRKQQLLLGYCIAKGSYLALIVNTIVVPVGLVVLGAQISSTVWSFLSLVLAAIGCIVAILSDTMTLSSAARVRKTREAMRVLEAKYDQLLEDEMTEALKKRKRRDLNRLRKTHASNEVSLIFFILVSAGLGDIFWHWCLQGLHNDVLSWSFSVVFSLLVSGTMCASQLYKADNDALIGESIEAGNYMALALKKDADAKAVSILAKKYQTEITELAEDTDVIKMAISEHSETIYDELLAGGRGRIPMRIQQEKYAERELTKQQLALMAGDPIKPIQLHSLDEIETRFEGGTKETNEGIVPMQLYPMDEPVEPNRSTILKGTMPSEYGDQIEALYRQNPSIKAAEIARQTGCTYHTAKKWLERVKPSKPNNAS